MKLTFNFQTLIMAVLAGALAVVTLVWAATVYDSVYRLILHGFDRQLLALAGSAATLTDAEGHADYQRPYRIELISTGPGGGLIGQDGERGVLVAIDPADGGAQALPGPELPPLRALSFDPASAGLAALSADGTRLWTGTLGADQPLEERVLEAAADEVVHVAGLVYLRRGRVLSALDPAAAPITLDLDVTRLASGGREAPLLALSSPPDAVLSLGPDGREIARQPLATGEHRVTALAHLGGVIYLAGESLLRLEPGSADPVDDFEPGWYSERDPYFARHAPAYRQVREAAGLTFLYTQQYLGGDQIRYILDGSVGEDHSPPGYLDTVPEDSLADVEAAQLRGRSFVSAIREWDVWGMIKVSAEPIIAADGRVVAMAGADVDIGVIREKTRRALIAVLLVGVGLLLVAGWVSLRVAQSMTQPVREIKDSALRIAAGDLGARIGSRERDELGELAESLDALANRLEAQARQAESYHDALERSRLDTALDHALADLAHRSGAMAAPPRERPAVGALPRQACAFFGQHGLIWPAERAAEAASETEARARVIAHRLLATTGDAFEAASGFASVRPGLPQVLAIDLAARSIRALGTPSPRIDTLDGRGARRTITFVDGRAELPEHTTALVFDGDEILPLAGMMSTEGGTC